MAFDAHVLKVLVASPGDTGNERAAVETSLHSWNGARGERENVILLPWLWEKNSVPLLGGSAQSIINSQAVDDSDIVFAVFDSRLGEATADAVSGTAEEIQRAHNDGKPVHVYFSNEPLPRDADLQQVQALRDFKAILQGLGLLGEYANPEDLAFQVRNAVESDLPLLGLGAVTVRKAASDHAIPRLAYHSRREPNGVDSKGRPKYRDRQRIVVENKSHTTTAEQFRFEVTGDIDGRLHLAYDGEPFDLIADAEMQWVAVPIQMSSATFTLHWVEDGHEMTANQVVALID